jgi:hypothetical protein
MLHVALRLDRGGDILVELVLHQSCQGVSLGEPLAQTFAMLISAASDISGDASVERAGGTVRHE